MAGGMLQRGITIKNCSSVFLLNNTKSFEKYIQCSYRCLSENNNKKYGVIVDFDFKRILSIFSYYEDDNINMNTSITNKIKYIINNNIIFINQNPDILKRIKELEKEIKKLKEIDKIKNKEKIEYLEIEYTK